ncbi:hypothetical protein GEMRC1_007350 [Eukaryota sp. GEM-RC1]
MKVFLSLLLVVLLVQLAYTQDYKRALFYSNHGCGLAKWPAARVFKDDHMRFYPDLSSFPNTVHPHFEFYNNGERYMTFEITEHTSLEEILAVLKTESIYRHDDPLYMPVKDYVTSS